MEVINMTAHSDEDIAAAKKAAKEYCEMLISSVVWNLFVAQQGGTGKVDKCGLVSTASTRAASPNPTANDIAKVVVEKAIANSVRNEAELAQQLVAAIITNAIDRLEGESAAAREFTEKTEASASVTRVDEEERMDEDDHEDIDDFPSSMMFTQHKKSILGDGEDSMRKACARACLPKFSKEKGDTGKRKGLLAMFSLRKRPN